MRAVEQRGRRVGHEIERDVRRRGDLRVRQLGPERGLVEGAGGLLPGVEMAAVRGRPPTVCALDQVGHDDVGVELGIPSPAGPVAEGSTDEAIGFQQLLSPGTSLDEASLRRQVVEHGADGPVVGDRDRLADLVGSERPQQRDPLGDRERQVVAGTSLGTELDPETATIGCFAREQVAEHVGVDLADQPKPFGGRADPLARRLAPAEVVVVDAVGNLVEVVLGAARGAEPPYREHWRAQQSTHRDRSTFVWSR